jgi:hypothetical protein
MKILAAVCLPVATLAVAFLLTTGVRAAADTINWTNTTSGGWNTAANWSPNTVPGSADTAIITNAGVTVSLNGATTIGAIILGTNGPGMVTLSLAGQTLTLNGPLTVNPSGSFTVDSGALVGTTNAVLNGTIGWSAGFLEGILTLASGGTLNITAGNIADMPNCTFTNNGTVVWASGTIRGGGVPGTFIYNYGLWDAQSDQTFNSAYGGNGTAFNNFGTFRKSGGASEFASAAIFQGVVFNQLAGVLDVQNGTNGLEVAFQGGGNFTGGYITTNSQGLTVLSAGNFTVNGTVTGTNTWQNIGNLVGTNVIHGGLTWVGGNWNNVASVTIATNSTVIVAGGGGNNDMGSCIVTNNGTVVWASGTIRGGNSPGTVIYNYGLWDAQSDQIFNSAYGGTGTVFNNYGTFRKSGGASEFSNATIFQSVVFNQLAGVLDVQNGTNGLEVAFQDGGNFTGGYITTNSQGLTALSAGNFTINGTVTGTNTWQDIGYLVGTNVINGGLTWVGGNWNNAAVVTIATNSTVIVAGGGGNNDMANCIVTNNGTVVWASGTIRGGNPGTVIYNYGLWDAQSDQQINAGYGGNMVFNNFGTFRKSGSTGGNTTIAISAFNNAGTIDVQTNSVIFQTDATFSPGSVFNGAGSTILSSGTFSINGATINSTLQFNGGSIGGTNTLSGTFIWNGGSFNSATLMITIGGVLNINGANLHDMPNCTLINHGTVTWASGTIRGGAPGTFIYNYGLWDAQSDQELNDAYGGGTFFNNFGTFRKSAGTKPNSTTIQSGVAFVNDGTVDAQNGLILFSGSFMNSASTLAVENGATIQIAQPVVLPGGLVTGSGTVQAPSITSSAVVRPGATNAVLTIAGNYTQLLGGSIQFDIGGTSPGVNQSQVNVTGSASLSGLIALRFSPGYVPTVNSSNLVLTAGSRIGQFNFQDHFYLLGQNKRIVPVYSPTNLVLATISAADPTNFSLSTAVRGQTFALAWPSEFTGYYLVTKTNLEDVNWTSVPGVTNFYAETPMTSPHKFFRLFPAP